MKTIKACLLSAFASVAVQVDEPDSDGATHWINQSGSTMEITEGPDGRLSGSYRSALGCGKGVERPLTGWRNGSAWVFSVHFGECGSVTSWVGHMKQDKQLSTIWTLARGGSDDWNMKLTGTSEFRRNVKASD